MGQCMSSPVVGGETEQAYRAKWEAGGGLPAYQDNKFMSSPSPAAKQHVYSTTADVGMGRNDLFQHDKFRASPLDAIDENNSLQLAANATAAATPASNGSPQRQQQPAMIAPPLARDNSKPLTPSKVPENWTKGELIGQGAFGSVYLGMDNDTGQLIAVKQVSLGQRGGPQAAAKLAEHVRSLEAEVQLLQDLNHPNIVRYLGTERTPDALNIFLEYVPGGSIASLLAKFGSFQESVVRVYTKQILQGLLYLHGQGVVHRDIKGANILVANTGLVKLADFGASKKIEGLATMESGFKSVKGTPYWMAPEVITATGHGKQADIWSVACTVIEMATGKPPWMQFGSQVAAMFHIAKSKGPPTIPEHLSPECKDFLYLCFNRNWKERPTAATLLQHAFLKNVDVVATGSVGNGNGVVVSGDLNQIPAYRASGGSIVAGGVAAAGGAVGRQGSPPKPGVQGAARSNNTGMSPLGNHLASRGNGLSATPGASAGPRRQLNLDGVGAGGHTSPSKRPSAVMSSAPVFANIRDSTGVGPPSAALLDGRLTRPATTPRGGSRPAGAGGGGTNNNMRESSQLIVPDPATLGSLRRSGSASLSLSKDGPAVSSSCQQKHQQQHPASTVDMNSNLMATIALSSGIDDNASIGNGCTSLQGSHQGSLASTAQQSSCSGDTEALGEVELEGVVGVDATNRSVDQANNVRPHSGTGSGVSQNSKKSEFNPMEEPAWMAGGGGGNGGNDSSSRDSLGNSSGNITQSGSPSDGEATSINPLPTTTNTMMPPPPPPSNTARQQQQQLRRSNSGRLLRKSSSSSFSQGASATTNSDGGSAISAAKQEQQPSGTAASASEGPVVYTIEADLDGFGGSSGLPWDMPDATNTTATTATATLSGVSSQLPAASASLGQWGRPSPSSADGASGSGTFIATATISNGRVSLPQISSAAASAATPATSTSSGEDAGAVDQNVILTALQQCAQRDLRASLALFAEAKQRHKASRSSSLNSQTSSENVVVAAPKAPTVNEDPTEVTSPARHRVSVQQSRIPRAPSESPIGKQQRQSITLNTTCVATAAAATPRRFSQQQYHSTAAAATPTKIAMAPSRSGSLTTAVTPSKTVRRTSSQSVAQSPRATPSKQLRAAAYSSPTKRQYTASVGSGSYEQQLRARQAGANGAVVGGVSTNSGAAVGGSYAARAAGSTPAKSANAHPLRTPRRDGGGNRSGSAGMTPHRRASIEDANAKLAAIAFGRRSNAEKDRGKKAYGPAPRNDPRRVYRVGRYIFFIDFVNEEMILEALLEGLLVVVICMHAHSDHAGRLFE